MIELWMSLDSSPFPLQWTVRGSFCRQVAMEPSSRSVSRPSTISNLFATDSVRLEENLGQFFWFLAACDWKYGCSTVRKRLMLIQEVAKLIVW